MGEGGQKMPRTEASTAAAVAPHGSGRTTRRRPHGSSHGQKMPIFDYFQYKNPKNVIT